MTPLQKTLVGVHDRDLTGFLGESMAMCDAVLSEMKRRGKLKHDGAFYVPIQLPQGICPNFKQYFQPMAA